MNKETWAEFEQRWAVEQKLREQKCIAKVRPILKELKARGVHQIKIEYQGSGDEGCIDEIDLEPSNLVDLTPKQREYIEELAFTYLPDGWEINNGSEGKMYLELEDTGCSINLEHYVYQLVEDENASSARFDWEE